jgi:hypothetical protein
MANMMLPISSSSVMPTFPTATPMQSTFFSWNLMVDLTSLILLARSSAWETGAGNFPALERPGPRRRGICLIKVSDATKASYLRASSAKQLVTSLFPVLLTVRTLDKLLVLVQLLQVVAGHGVDTVVLGAIDIVLVTEDTDGHARAGDGRETDGSRETLVTLGIVVLQADLELDRLQEVALLGLIAVLEEFFNSVSDTERGRMVMLRLSSQYA